MIDQGIVMLVNSGLGSVGLGNARGFFAELPKDNPLPSWTYRTISQVLNSTLQSFTGLNMLRLQIDCYGAIAVDAIKLAASIDGILNGFQGTLSDPDATFVSSCLRSDVMDFFNDAPRNYRRLLEYEILFAD